MPAETERPTGAPGTRTAEHRTVTRVATILEAVAAVPDGLRLGALRELLDAPKSSVYGLVKGLVAVGYLAEQDGRYVLGTAMSTMATAARPTVVDVARAPMEKLHRRFDETVMLGSMTGETLVYLDTIESTQAIRYSPPKVRRHFENPSSMMKLHLAERAPEQLDEYLLTRISVPKRRKELAAELAGVRERGVAFNRGDTFPDLSAAASGVIERGELVACIAVGGPSHRVDPLLDEITPALIDASAEISQLLAPA